MFVMKTNVARTVSRAVSHKHSSSLQTLHVGQHSGRLHTHIDTGRVSHIDLDPLRVRSVWLFPLREPQK